GMILLVLGSCVSSCHELSQGKKPDPTTPNFPFTIADQRGTIVFIAPEHFNQKNIESLFRWHYKKYLGERGAPTMIVFTEKDLLNAYLEDRKKPWWESEIPREYKTPSPPPPPSLSSRKTFYDAWFSMAPSEPSIDFDKEDDKYSRGFNVFYYFSPDLTQPHIHKTVVLRGSTWT